MEITGMCGILLILSMLAGINSEELNSGFLDSCQFLVGISKGDYCPITENINTNINLPKNCKEVYNNGYKNSGVYKILPSGSKKTLTVLCDMEIEGGGWTHIQKRFDGSENFNRPFRDYKFGFGNLKAEFWLGLENMHQFTGTGTNELLIEITDHNLVNSYARYTVFKIGSEYEGYPLQTLAGYSGNTTSDCFKRHEGFKFSTFDLDRDIFEKNCASLAGSGWWFRRCFCTNLNGELRNMPSHNTSLRGMRWDKLVGNSVTDISGISVDISLLSGSRMLIRPKS